MSITGVIKALDVPQDACLTTMYALIKSLEKYLAVEFDAEKITNVVVSPSEPDTTDRDVIWFRIGNSGNFVGINVFVQDHWVQMFPPPFQVIRMYGRSDDIPEGFELVNDTMAGFSTAMVNHLKGDGDDIGGWMEDPSTPGVYLIFDVVYVGL